LPTKTFGKDDSEDFPVSTYGKPARPDFRSFVKRFKSFLSWPTDHRQSGNEMAKAGFFYTGKSCYNFFTFIVFKIISCESFNFNFSGIEDRVYCFHCGGGYHKWEANDDPWKEHAKWNPKCDFLLMVKGADFVSAVQDSLTEIDFDLCTKWVGTKVCFV
jgi:hypothetical protein